MREWDVETDERGLLGVYWGFQLRPGGPVECNGRVLRCGAIAAIRTWGKGALEHNMRWR